ncbi:MAG TPA: endolytic transglycosylase MltG [Candidatus Paceibacterota bacterium]|nr:endolytic transglycosylase MltG [Candidatus Paceibacterota bacterium]
MNILTDLYECFYGQLRDLRDWRVRIRGAWMKDANKRSTYILLTIIIAVSLVYWLLLSPPPAFPTSDIITIPQGASLTGTAQELADAHIVRSAAVLRLIVTLEGGQGNVVAGDYQFATPVNAFSVAHLITTGTFGLVPVRITVPEGATVDQIADLFGAHLKKFDKAAFVAKAKPLEGFLFPDTYFFLPNADQDQVMRTMLSNFQMQIAPLQPAIATSTHSLSDIVIMASILEKEARDYTDRQKIAGVLWKRIAIGMPLQVDSVFLYSLGKSTFDLTKQDLQSDSPYNTYVNKGLPPTPIDNPSLSSIKAALDPIDTGALFYLADNNGVTHYSKTYAQHLEFKAEYLGP